MGWEIYAIAGLVFLIAGVALLSMRKIKAQSEFASFGGSKVDVDELAQKLAKAIGAEFRAALKDELKNLKISSGSGGFVTSRGEVLDSGIEMDERIIPMAVKTTADLTNLEGMATEEVAVDKDLKKSKSKLKDLLKKKKES